MPHMTTYAVLGAGRQGTAAAYDMARWGEAERVLIADADGAAAPRAAARVNALLGRDIVTAAVLDVRDVEATTRFLQPVDAFLSAVPYPFNPAIAEAALRARACMCDLGGHIGLARQQHALADRARQAGISIVPNCGQVPGLGTTLMVHAMELLDEADEVFMWDGGIPETPRPPFNYLLTFNVAGLTNEYAEPAIFLRDGKITEMEPMSEVETMEFPPPIGTLEAFIAGGGTDTMPWTYEGRVRTLQNKTLRHPGHFAQLRAFWDLGLWDLQPQRVGDAEVVPRDVFHALFEPKVTFPGDRDVCVIRVRAHGRKDGRAAWSQVDLVDRYDEATSFTAMERCTGWSAAVVAQMAAAGEIEPGAGGVEVMVPAEPFVQAMRRRGVPIAESVQLTG